VQASIPATMRMLFLHKKWQDILKITTKRTGWRELAHMVLLEMLGFREVYKKTTQLSIQNFATTT